MVLLIATLIPEVGSPVVSIVHWNFALVVPLLLVAAILVIKVPVGAAMVPATDPDVSVRPLGIVVTVTLVAPLQLAAKFIAETTSPLKFILLL